MRVELSGAELDALVHQQESAQVPPGRGKAQAREQERATAVRQRAIEDAVLVAEARRLGMDQDEIVRARLVQKQLFLAEELAGTSRAPTESELRAYYDAHRSEHRLPPRFVFTHVFAKTKDTAQQLLQPVRSWAGSAPDNAIAPFGDAFPLSRLVRGTDANLSHSFGDDFTSALTRAPQGQWVGPLRSRYGFHLVKLTKYEPPRQARFEEVRGELPLRLLIERREQAVAAYLRSLLRRYHVSIDGEPVVPHEPRPRTAPRAAGSAEDG